MDTKAIEMAAGRSQPVLYTFVLATLERLRTSRTARLLDVGCGHGHLLTELAAAGYSDLTGCDGIEHPDSLPAGARFTRHDLEQGLGVEAEGFDVVTSIEVIEHLENPRAHVRQLHGACRPGGRVVLSTPNALSLVSKLSFLFRGYFAYFDDWNYPAHITPVLPIDLGRIFAEIGFHQIEVCFSNAGRMVKLDASWQSLFGRAIGSRLFRGAPFSDQVFVVARK